MARIPCCCGYGAAAIVPIPPQAWEPPHDTGAALKSKKQTNRQKKSKQTNKKK